MGIDESNIQEFEELQNGKEKKTQSQILVEMAHDVELFHDPDDKAYAAISINDYTEVMPLRKKKFKRWLQMKFYDKYQKVAGSQAVEDALSMMEGAALFKGEEHEVFTRLAEHEGKFYIDMANESHSVIEVGAEGWQVVNDSPVYFKQTNALGELPEPKRGGSIEQLRPFINTSTEDDFKMAVSWVLGAMRPDAPYPVLLVQGEQGSSKSTTTKVLRSLIDPSDTMPLRNLPKSEEELAIAASKAHIGAYDNISHLSNTLSDTFCKVAVGGSVAKRELYSDDEETVITVRKPSILNGINDVAKRPDLLDRSIMLNLPSIPEEKRTDEQNFWKRFEEARPYIIGAFLDVISGAIKELPSITLEQKPRMADFALWLTAAEKALGWDSGEFMEIYTRNHEEGVQQSLETDPLAVAVMAFMRDHAEWIGTPTETHKKLEEYIEDKRTLYSNAWVSPRGLKGRLTRIAPGLRKQGIHYENLENSGQRKLKLYRSDEEPPEAEEGDVIL